VAGKLDAARFQGGRIEPRPHRRHVRNEGGSGLSLLNLPANDKVWDTVRREPLDQPLTARPRSDAEAIQGTWRLISQQSGGRATARPTNMKWVIEHDTIWLVVEREGGKRPGR
jgi:hypothetical protein